MRTAERAARALISAGGVGTIVAVTLILVFLVWEVVPLFAGADLDERGAADALRGDPIAAGTDEDRRIGWTLARDGRLAMIRLDAGTVLAERRLFREADAPTAWSFPPGGSELALGYADGTIRTGRIGFETSFLRGDAVPPALRGLAKGAVAPLGEGMAEGTGEGRLRVQTLRAELDEPVRAAPAAIERIDLSVTSTGRAYATLSADRRLAVHTETVRENMLTGERVRRLSTVDLPYAPPPGRAAPDHLLLSGVGTHAYLAWRDGFVERYDAAGARLAETLRLVEPGVEVTAFGALLGKTTLVAGDARGRVRAWFLTKPEGAGTVDGAALVLAHEMAGPAAPVTSLTASRRSRLLAAGYGNGEVRVLFVTGARTLARAAGGGDPVAALAFAPKQDGLLAVGPSGARAFDLDAKYPEAAPAQLFAKVWYEGHEEPAHVWQSTGGTDEFEPKLGLVPLVFGTLKATLYSIAIAAPLALLAAVFTSEFLEARRRARVKAAIEMMASLPSVVLGFLAALVIAPFVERVLPATLSALATVPFCVLLGARLWQLLPQRVSLRLEGFPRVLAIGLALGAGALLAALAGPPLERILFDGDLRRWLADREFGGAAGGWVPILLPAGVLAAALLSTFVLSPWLRRRSTAWSSRACAAADLARYLLAAAVAVAVAWLGAAGLGALGADARGPLLGGYQQRNALVVGFVMGFAIVPILYTLAEDALSSVPVALRAASLGAGATPWQTAWRVVMPTAMSGLFGALMVGLGRAVGETMIVLMAAGNTPVLEWNAFSGFRTLSANVAVELPEAARGSVHYRTLFVCALVLFAMTFALNTAAELVRRRFRRRFAQL